MGTMYAVAAFVAIMLAVWGVIALLWGDYEIDDSEYPKVRKILDEYPHLGKKYLLRFNKDAIIMRSELRAMEKEYNRLIGRRSTAEILARRRAMIDPLLNWEDKI